MCAFTWKGKQKLAKVWPIYPPPPIPIAFFFCSGSRYWCNCESLPLSAVGSNALLIGSCYNHFSLFSLSFPSLISSQGSPTPVPSKQSCCRELRTCAWGPWVLLISLAALSFFSNLLKQLCLWIGPGRRGFLWALFAEAAWMLPSSSRCCQLLYSALCFCSC